LLELLSMFFHASFQSSIPFAIDSCVICMRALFRTPFQESVFSHEKRQLLQLPLLPLLAAIDEQAQHDNDVKDRTKNRRDLFDGDIV